MTDRTIQPELRSMERFSLPRPEIIKLQNGIELQVLQAGQGEVVRLDVVMRGGRWHQQQLLQSLFTNRMLREGGLHLNSNQIAERLDYYGAWLDLSTSIKHSFVSLYSLNKYFAQSLEVVCEMLQASTFPDHRFQVVREANKQQFLLTESRVEGRSRKAFFSALFGEEHPMGQYATAESYDAIQTTHLQDFYRQCYHSNNCTLVLSGMVTDEILTLVEQYLGNQPWGNTSSVLNDNPIVPHGKAPGRIFIHHEGAVQSSVRAGCLMVECNHPDYAKLKVLTTLLGGYFGSRLMKNIREDKGYTYGIGSVLQAFPDCGVFVIATEADNRYVEPLMNEVYKEIDQLRNQLVGTEELEMVRNYMLGDLARTYEGALTLPEAWLFRLVNNASWDCFDRDIDTILSITPQEIQRLANSYLCKENLIEVVVGEKMK